MWLTDLGQISAIRKFQNVLSFHQFSVHNTFDLMEFHMVWNTSTTTDFPNAARGLKIKILASNVILWSEWLSFSPAFGTFAPPKALPLSLLPNSIEKMTQSYLQGSGRRKLHNGSCHLPKNWKDLSYSNILVRNHTSNFFESQDTSRKGSLWLVNEKNGPSIWASLQLLPFLWVFGVWKEPVVITRWFSFFFP